jgi:phage shock protein C
MQISENLLTRDDTFFGVCEAIGEDLGVNANILRVAFGVLLLWNPLAVLGTYFALGAIVLLSRLLAPATRRAAAPADAVEEPAAETVEFADPEPVQLAA